MNCSSARLCRSPRGAGHRRNARRVLAALAPADTAGKLDAVLHTYLAFIRGRDLVSAASAIAGAGRIARARPDLLDRFVPAIPAIERATCKTPECRNVAIGRALQVLAELGPGACQRLDVVRFARRQQKNTRPAVARRAQHMAANLLAGPGRSQPG